MTTLLNPSDCCVLFVDPQDQHFGQLVSTISEPLVSLFRRLSDAISVANVPSHLVMASQGQISQHQLLNSCASSRPTVHVERDIGPTWSSSGVATALVASNRTSLVICGFWLETKVSFLALSALSAGFDVYLLADATPSRVPATRETSIARLLQAGVVPTTLPQLLAEWVEQSSDLALRASLGVLIC
ncbi:MAG: isochorismatase family protein [Hyphomicrobiales bacterium]|nr:MAG: isochorismatase family protein [Hyphomicrobiales bacterium]